jgi:monovalent cation:H+ antiporter-2, CPA2 family
MSRSERIADLAEALEPRFLKNGIVYYHNCLERFSRLPAENRLWQLSRKRIMQIGLGVFFVSGLLLVAEPVSRAIERVAGADLLFPYGTLVLFWGGVGVIVLFPLYAVWRNISVMALMLAEAAAGRRRDKVLPSIIEQGIKAVMALLLLFWLWFLLPLGAAAGWVFAALILWAIGMTVLFRRRLIRIHSQVEFELQQMMSEDYHKSSRVLPPWLSKHRDLHLSIAECVVPDNAACGGKTIGALALRQRFGSSIVGVDRQGFIIGNPGPQTVLYPRDRLLLLGKKEQNEAARRVLTEETGDTQRGTVGLDDVQMENVFVPLDSPRVNQSLAELDVNRVTGVQVAGIQRRERLIVNPGGDVRIQAADELVVLGLPEAITRFRQWLMPENGSDSGT